jgi:hypothetical protein
VSAGELTLRLIEVAAPGQTLFVLLYGLGSPWWRSPTGRAIFTKGLSLMLIFDVAIAAYYIANLPDWIGTVVVAITTVGVYLQLGALIHERRRAGVDRFGRNERHDRHSD